MKTLLRLALADILERKTAYRASPWFFRRA
jgi:hypothetical protein